jgi:hypothetical protein
MASLLCRRKKPGPSDWGQGISRRLYWPTRFGGRLNCVRPHSWARPSDVHTPRASVHPRRCRLALPNYVHKLTASWADMDCNAHMANTAYLNRAVDARYGILHRERLTASRTHAPAHLVGRDEGRSRVRVERSSGWRRSPSRLLWPVLPRMAVGSKSGTTSSAPTARSGSPSDQHRRLPRSGRQETCHPADRGSHDLSVPCHAADDYEALPSSFKAKAGQ